MQKNIYSRVFMISTLFFGYSATKLVKSVKKFNTAIKYIDFASIRKDTNHINETVSMRISY